LSLLEDSSHLFHELSVAFERVEHAGIGAPAVGRCGRVAGRWWPAIRGSSASL